MLLDLFSQTHNSSYLYLLFQCKSLGWWVHDLRQARKGNRKTKISDEPIKKLEAIGFVWEVRVQVLVRVRWDARFEELKEYKATHGNCLVPAIYPDNPVGSLCCYLTCHVTLFVDSTLTTLPIYVSSFNASLLLFGSVSRERLGKAFKGGSLMNRSKNLMILVLCGLYQGLPSLPPD